MMKIIIKILLMFTLIMIILPVNIHSQWYPQNSGINTTLYAVDFLDTLNGYVSGDAGKILKTTNGGSTWINLLTSGVSVPLFSVSFLDTQNGCAVGGYGIIIRTSNGGASWTQITSSTTASMQSVQFINSGTGFITTLTGQGLGSTDGGFTWTIYSNQISNHGSHYKSFFVNSLTGYVGEDGGYLSKTTDGGHTWFDASNGIPTSDPLLCN